MSENQMMISIHHIEENKIRKINKKKVEDYTASIKARGILQPIAVKKHKDKQGIFILLDGHHRRLAGIAAGLQELPCYIPDNASEYDEIDDVAIALQGNIKRLNMSPTQVGNAILMMFKVNPELTQAQIGEKLNITAGEVSKFTRVAKLPKYFQDLIDSGNIMVGHAALATRLIKYLSQEDTPDWRIVSDNAQEMDQATFVSWVAEQVKALREKAKGVKKDIDPKTLFRQRKKKEVITMINSLRGREDQLDEKQAGFLKGLEWSTQTDPDSVNAYLKKEADKQAEKDKKEKEDADKAFAEAATILGASEEKAEEEVEVAEASA